MISDIQYLHFYEINLDDPFLIASGPTTTGLMIGSRKKLQLGPRLLCNWITDVSKRSYI